MPIEKNGTRGTGKDCSHKRAAEAERAEAFTPDGPETRVPFMGILGLDGYYVEDSSMGAWRSREYFVSVPGGDLLIASSCGGDVIAADRDGDGLYELICSDVSGGDGHPSLSVYRRRGGVIEVGWMDFDRIDTMGWVDWGLNSAGSLYDPNDGAFIFSCDTEVGPVERRFYDYSVFVFEEHAVLPDSVVYGNSLNESDELLVYRNKLRNMLWKYGHTGGKGAPFYVLDSFSGLAKNQFAICDVNGDGLIELLFRYTAADMAGMCEYVWVYDKHDVHAHGVELWCEGRFFPDTTYYENGYMTALWSHNQVGSVTIWPYTLNRYNAKTDAYEEIAGSLSWEKQIRSTNPLTDEGAFPDDADADGDGVVYLLWTDSGDVGDGMRGFRRIEYLDNAAYDAWVESWRGGAEEIVPDWQAFTIENINAIGRE